MDGTLRNKDLNFNNNGKKKEQMTLTTFARQYKVLEKLGEGSYSEVLKCKDRQTGVEYAAKKLKHTYRKRQVDALAEVIAMRQLSKHPNILNMHELHYDASSGGVWLVLEAMDCNLYELIKKRNNKLFPESRVKWFICQLLRALKHLHKNLIFHRDVKPENILLNESTDTVKLGDLGSVKGESAKAPYTEYISTRWYRSPECLLTTGYYNRSMDIWAAGCVFYETLTLRPLFPGSSELDQIHRIHKAFGPPSQKMLQRFSRLALQKEYLPKNSHKQARRDGIVKMLNEMVMPKKPEWAKWNSGDQPNVFEKDILPKLKNPDCRKLIHQMLQYEAEKRPSCGKILEHPYFDEHRMPKKRGAVDVNNNVNTTTDTPNTTTNSSRSALDNSLTIHEMNSGNYSHNSSIRSFHLNNFGDLGDKQQNSVDVQKSYDSPKLYYWTTLQQTCEKTQKLPVKDIPGKLNEIVDLVREIWSKSSDFTTYERINGIFRKFSNGIIRACVNEVIVDDVFFGRLDRSETSIQACLDCLNAWKLRYIDAQKLHSVFAKLTCYVDVDAFIHRLKDLKELCACQRLYGARAEGRTKLAVVSSYPTKKGKDLVKVVSDIQKTFERQLRVLFLQRHHIVDVLSTTWPKHMQTFRLYMKDGENHMQMGLASAFATANSLVEGLHLLESFHLFHNRDMIRRTYDKLVTKLYGILEDQTTEIRQLFTKHVLPQPLRHRQLAGRAAWAQYLRRKIEIQIQLLKDASWLPECGFGEDVCKLAALFCKSLQEFSAQMYSDWLKIVGVRDLRAKLDTPLMVRGTNTEGIEINFDQGLHELILDAEIWSRLNYKIPQVLRVAFDQREKFQTMRDSVRLIVKDYNQIVSSLSSDEWKMFSQQIKIVEKKIQVGISKLSWTSTLSDVYVHECKFTAKHVQQQIAKYKSISLKIAKMIVKMSSHLLVAVDPQEVLDGVEFNIWQKNHRENAVLKILANYKEIGKLLSPLNKMFNYDSDVKKQWIKQLKIIDQLIKEALCVNVRRSLEIFRRTIYSDLPFEPSPHPVLRIDIVLDGKRLDFQPSLTQVKDMILGIHKNISASIKPIPRIIQFINEDRRMNSYSYFASTDETGQKTKEYINEGFINCVLELGKYLKMWDSMRHIWELDKENYMKKYEQENPSPQTYERDITHYRSLIKTVNEQDSAIHVSFCVLHCDKLKTTIVNHCKDWEQLHFKSLVFRANVALLGAYDVMRTDLSSFREPIVFKDLLSLTKRFQEYVKDVNVKENTIPTMNEQFDLLKKLGFTLNEDMKRQYSHFASSWSEFVRKVKEVAALLKKTGEKFREASQENN